MGYGDNGYRVRVKGDERLVAYQYLGLTDLGPFTRFANKHSVLIARRDPNELLTLKFPWSPGTGVRIRPTEWLIVNTNAAACDSCSVITDEHFQREMLLLGTVQPTAENTDTCAKPEVPEDTQKVDTEGCPEYCVWCEESDHDGSRRLQPAGRRPLGAHPNARSNPQGSQRSRHRDGSGR